MPTSVAYEASVDAASAISGWRLDDGAGPAASDFIDSKPGVYGGSFALGQAGFFSDRLAVHLTGGSILWTPSPINFGNSAPISLFVKFDATTPAADGVLLAQGTITAGWNLQHLHSNGHLFVGQPGVGGVDTGFAVPDLNWHHLLFQGFASINGYELWWDGVMKFSSSLTNQIANASKFSFGAETDGSSPLHVTLSELALFGVHMDPATIKSVSLSGTTGVLQGSTATTSSLTAITADLAACQLELDDILNAVRRTFPTT